MTDLQVLASVWGAALPYAKRDPDLEGWDGADVPAMLERLLRSADVEVRVGNLFADPAHEVDEVEVHVWAEPDDPPALAENSPRVRRLRRGAETAALVVTVPIPKDVAGVVVHARAYYMLNPDDPSTFVGADVMGVSPASPIATLDAVLPGEDRVAVFGPVPTVPLERYVVLAFDQSTFKGDVLLIDPSGATAPRDLLDGVPYFANGGAPPTLGCSARGEHVVLKANDEAWVFRADGTVATYPITDPRALGSPLLSDNEDELVWLSKPPQGPRAIVIEQLPSGGLTTIGLGDFKASPFALSLDPAGTHLLVNDHDVGGSQIILELTAGVPELAPSQRVLDLETEAMTTFYDREITASTPTGVHTGRVQAAGASWRPDGAGAIFVSDEALGLETKATLENPKYVPNAEVFLELYQAAPGAAAATALTTGSESASGAIKTMPVLSPSGRQVLFFHWDLPGKNLELRLMNVGAPGSVVLRSVAPSGFGQLLGACWLRD